MNTEQIYIQDRIEKIIEQGLTYIKLNYDPEYENEVAFILQNTE